jgi:alkylhydroperoxidase family enzyme
VLDPELVKKVLDDYKTAPIDGKLRATLAFLEKLTRTPSQLGADDARAALAAGVSKKALAQAAQVAALFNILDRLADAMGWVVPDQAGFEQGAGFLLKRGYRM